MEGYIDIHMGRKQLIYHDVSTLTAIIAVHTKVRKRKCFATLFLCFVVKYLTDAIFVLLRQKGVLTLVFFVG